jgi:alpha-tubulin suppressor-like RCC1 family protein
LGGLGVGDKIDRYIPMLLNVSNIIQASAGDYHTIVLDKFGNVFSCGQGVRKYII